MSSSKSVNKTPAILSASEVTGDSVAFGETTKGAHPVIPISPTVYLKTPIMEAPFTVDRFNKYKLAFTGNNDETDAFFGAIQTVERLAEAEVAARGITAPFKTAIWQGKTDFAATLSVKITKQTGVFDAAGNPFTGALPKKANVIALIEPAFIYLKEDVGVSFVAINIKIVGDATPAPYSLLI